MSVSTPTAAPATPADWAVERARYEARIEALEQQLAWFKRQLFGSTSERRIADPDGRQLALGEVPPAEEATGTARARHTAT